MENEFPFMDLSQFTQPEDLTGVAPTSIVQHHQSIEIGSSHQTLHSVSPMLPSKVGKRQTSRQKYTDEEVQRICSMKEAGLPWSKIAEQFPGRSQKSLQVSYCVNFKKRTEKFQDGDKELLQRVLREEMDDMWKRVSNRMGKSVKGCQQKAKEWGIGLR